MLNDTANVRWPRTQLLSWISDAQKQLAIQIPGASNKSISLQLVAGTRQSLPADAWILADIFRNMGTDGVTVGRAIRFVSREMLDGINPSWHTDTASSVVLNFLYDPQDQTYFWVYPPSPGTNYVQVSYVFIPPELATEAGVITLSDVLEPLLLDYAMYRAMLVDAEYAPGIALAQVYFSGFNAAVTAYQHSTTDDDPNQMLKKPFDPARGGSNG